MKFENIEPEWPPVPLPTKISKREKSAFFRHTTGFIRGFTRDGEIRSVLNKAIPKDQSTHIHSTQLADVPPKVPQEAFLMGTENLSPFEMQEAQGEVNEVRMGLYSVINVNDRPTRALEFGRLSSLKSFAMDETVTADLINTWSEEHRIRLAHILALQHIQWDGALCHLYNKDRPPEEHVEEEDDDFHEILEQFAMIGDAADFDDDEDDEEDYFEPLPQHHYEYFVLQQTFYKIIEAKL